MKTSKVWSFWIDRLTVHLEGFVLGLGVFYTLLQIKPVQTLFSYTPKFSSDKIIYLSNSHQDFFWYQYLLFHLMWCAWHGVIYMMWLLFCVCVHVCVCVAFLRDLKCFGVLSNDHASSCFQTIKIPLCWFFIKGPLKIYFHRCCTLSGCSTASEREGVYTPPSFAAYNIYLIKGKLVVVSPMKERG